MKKTEFRILIREIVREEVAMAIKEVITELRKPTKSFIKTDSKKKRIEKKKYTKNSILNEMLLETADSDDWKTLGADTFTTNNMSELLSKEYGNTSKQSIENIPDAMGIDSSNVPEHINDALTKDYSKLMKAIDKKKNGQIA